jgi:DNA-binding NarL/FixJ family response regulator
VAAILGGDPGDRRHVAELLATAGFAPCAHDDLSAPIGAKPDTLAVLLGRGNAPERIRDLRTVAEMNPKVRIVASMPTDAPNASLRRALLAGAAGLVLDRDLDRALVATGHAVLAGQLAVPSALMRQIAPRPLSYREKQILGLVVLGFTNREIADKLFLAESTVKTHLSSSFAKLDAHSRSEAAARILDPEAGYGVGILAIAGDGTAAPGS